MKAIVFGSMNIDKVYTLKHLPEKGETLYCTDYETHVGGKGLNQAISISKAGADVIMAGQVGPDGEMLTEYLKNSGVKTDFIKQIDTFTGHAVIEVDSEGQNQMILYPGANKKINEDYCDYILEKHADADLILLQYETSCVEYMLRKAKSAGILTAINPSPYVEELKLLPFDCIDYIILNESEGISITGKTEPKEIAEVLCSITGGKTILTLGDKGAVYADNEVFTAVPAFRVNSIDTTGAGDTFTGYALCALIAGECPETALRTAAAASAIAVAKKGAAESIPSAAEVEDFLKEH